MYKIPHKIPYETLQSTTLISPNNPGVEILWKRTVLGDSAKILRKQIVHFCRISTTGN